MKAVLTTIFVLIAVQAAFAQASTGKAPDKKASKTESDSKSRAPKGTEWVYNAATKRLELAVIEDIDNRPSGSPELVQATDAGIPPKEMMKLKLLVTQLASSEWRTYEDKSGNSVSFNPVTSELFRNPVSGKLEPVMRESPSSGGTSNNRVGEAFTRAMQVGLDAYRAGSGTGSSVSPARETGRVGMDALNYPVAPGPPLTPSAPLYKPYTPPPSSSRSTTPSYTPGTHNTSH
jgi:hypothetical protein